MKKFIIQGILLVVIIFASLYLATTKNKDQLPFFPKAPKIEKAVIGQKLINVEIADTSDKRAMGLGGRESLASDSGMLFVFPKIDKYSFWMKGLKFPLDLIWIKDDKVADIIKGALPPTVGQSDKDLLIYMPNQPINKVLEVNSGFVDVNSIQLGDTVSIFK